MADWIESFTVTVAANVASPGVESVLTTRQDGVVERVEIVIPNGHAGLTGIAMFFSLAQVIPYVGGQFVRGNNRRYSFDLDNLPTGQLWQAFAFNTDIRSHSFRVLFHIAAISPLDDEVLPSVILLPYPG